MLTGPLLGGSGWGLTGRLLGRQWFARLAGGVLCCVHSMGSSARLTCSQQPGGVVSERAATRVLVLRVRHRYALMWLRGLDSESLISLQQGRFLA